MQIKQNENKLANITDKLESVSSTIIASKVKTTDKLFDKGVVKTALLNVASPMFSQYEKKLNESNRIKKTLKKFLLKINLRMM